MSNIPESYLEAQGCSNKY